MSNPNEELRTIVERLNPRTRRLLMKMKAEDNYSAPELQALLGEEGSKAQAVGSVGWLIANGLAVQVPGEPHVLEGHVKSYASLASKGQIFLEKGMPEVRIVKLLRGKEVLSMGELEKELDIPKEELNPILGSMKKEGVLAFRSGGQVSLERGSVVEDAEERYKKINALVQLVSRSPEGKVDLDERSREEKNIIKEMSRKRGKGKAVFRIAEDVDLIYKLTAEGEDAQKICGSIDETEEISSLTPEILEKELWRGQVFRKYDISTRPPKLAYGRKHPYGLFLDFVRKKLVAMGFEEMKGRMVETEFWNNDALFMPQDHPARAIHDVYFVKEPKYSKELPEDLVEKVARTHEDGWKTGSTGWRYEFDKERTSRFVLRSQGTANSVRMLASLPKIPGKYFAIARCFRYDQVDATHAPDFIQIEGIVLSPHMNFRRLLGLLKLFALEIAGSSEVRFLPGYFPFTEPSVEVQFRHKKLGWVELGGAGIFRKEVTLPLGIDVPVIAWGLGLDRMAMVALSIDDIRDLFTSDLGKVQEMKFNVQ